MSSPHSNETIKNPLDIHPEIEHQHAGGVAEVLSSASTAPVSTSIGSASSVESDRTVRPTRVSSAEPFTAATARSSSTDSIRTVIWAPISAPQAPTATDSEFYFKNCNVCEQDNPSYVGCNHPEDVPPFKTATMSAFASSEPIPGPTGKMLSAKGLRELFSANVDDVAKGIL